MEVDFFSKMYELFLWLFATTTPVLKWPQPALVSERSEAGCGTHEVELGLDRTFGFATEPSAEPNLRFGSVAHVVRFGWVRFGRFPNCSVRWIVRFGAFARLFGSVR